MADNDFNEFDDIEKDKVSSVGGDYGDIAAVESDKLCEDGVFKKKSKKKKKHKTMDVVSVADDDVKKKKIDSNREKGKRKRDDNDDDLGAETDERKSHKKKKKKPSVDLEVEETSLSSPALDSNKKRKEKKKKKKKKELSDDSKAEEKDLNSTKEENKEMESEDSEVEKNNNDFTKDANKEKKKMKQMDDIEAEEKDLNSTKDAKKKKQSEDSEVEENNKDSTKDANREKKKKKKQMEDSEAEEKDLNSTKDAKKKKKKKKQSEDSEVEKDAKKKKKRSKDSEVEEDANKKKKKKQKLRKSDKDVTTPSSKSSKKVKFSDKVEIFPSEDETNDDEEVEEAAGLVRGKRFTKEEDALLKQAVLQYIDNHALGDEGLQMVLQCKAHPKLKGCWKEIASAIPWRPYTSIYYRAHTVFEAGSKGVWTEEDLELVKEFQKKHGNDWRTLADAMGKHRIHVKDAWRRIRLNMNKGHWSREEYQSLFDLVNKDIKMKAFKEKHSKHGMLRDNIPWMAISDKLGTRNHSVCCLKWYDQLVSPMVAKGIWANVDDYRLLEELMKLDAACIDDVEWDNLLENRDGEACRKRWNQMVQHIGIPGSKTFAEQVEILSERYCPELAEDREDFDNRPYDPED